MVRKIRGESCRSKVYGKNYIRIYDHLDDTIYGRPKIKKVVKSLPQTLHPRYTV